jgi:hypothetical protein
MHCHFDDHQSFGLNVAFLVKLYKERNKHGDRKNGDRGEQYARYLLSSFNVDSKDYDLCPAPRLFQNAKPKGIALRF